jgi:hypothetical protein
MLCLEPALVRHQGSAIVGWLSDRESLPLPENVGRFDIDIIRSSDGVEYHLKFGHRYKRSLDTFEARDITVRKGAISVWYDDGGPSRGCSAGRFKLLQYNLNYELVPCSNDAVFVSQRSHLQEPRLAWTIIGKDE